jgi:hypothetical protein
MDNFQTLEEMLKLGATGEEAVKALGLFMILHPALKTKNVVGNIRIDTIYGDKSPLGLYRLLKEEIFS